MAADVRKRRERGKSKRTGKRVEEEPSEQIRWGRGFYASVWGSVAHGRDGDALARSAKCIGRLRIRRMQRASSSGGVQSFSKKKTT
jgi:hypothetical protein